MSETPKIQVDSDWKKQAQQEKERLAKEEESRSAGGVGGEAVGPEGLPSPSFAEILASVATQISMFLGEIADPATGRGVVHLPIAKHYIDLLAVLEAKTRGNLNDDEKKMMDRALYNARMRYVQVAGGSGTVGVPAGPEGDAPPQA